MSKNFLLSYLYLFAVLILLSINISVLAEANNKSKVSSSQGFDKLFKLQGISFHVSCPNNSSLNTLTIIPTGLEITNQTMTQEIDGSVIGAEIADLNGDGSPEIYIYINSAGSGSYGDVIAYSANNKKSLSSIYFPSLMENKTYSKGYMGHDNFTIIETSLARRFPIYKKGDSNSKPTGGTRQLQYKLLKGEASWILKVVDGADYVSEKNK